jgi:hypothetical protein
MTSRTVPTLLVVSMQPLDATTTLFFQHVASQLPGNIRITHDRGHDVAAAMSGASALVLVRGLFEFRALSRCARALKIPVYYFADDNFMVLRDQRGPAARFVEQYSVTAVRRALRRFAGVLLSSSPLVDYYASNGLHPCLLLYPPVASRPAASATPLAAPRLRVAFYGGLHLHDFLRHRIVPALRRVARERPVTLIVVGMTEPIPPSEGLLIVDEAYAESYARGLDTLADHGVDVLIHPVEPGLANNAFKNPHALISANQLGAVPIVSARAPYDGLQGEGVALFCDDAEDSWRQALLQAADRQTAVAIRTRLAAFCAERFSGRVNLQVINSTLLTHPAPARWSIPWRRSVIHAILLVSRALHIVAARVGPGRKAAAA